MYLFEFAITSANLIGYFDPLENEKTFGLKESITIKIAIATAKSKYLHQHSSLDTRHFYIIRSAYENTISI
jgi:hypothetical protein